jgi:WD40 repeat protein
MGYRAPKVSELHLVARVSPPVPPELDVVMLHLPPRLTQVRTLAFSPDNRLLLAVGVKPLLGGLLAFTRVALWDLAHPTARLRPLIDEGLDPIAGFFLPDGRVLGVDDRGNWQMCHPDRADPVVTSRADRVPHRVEPAALSPDGQWLGLVSRREFRCRSLADQSATRSAWEVRFPDRFEGLAAAFSPDGGMVAVLHHAPLDHILLEDPSRGAIYDTGIGIELAALPRWFTDLERLAWSPDGRFLVASGWGGFRVLEVERGVTVAERDLGEREPGGLLTAAAFHPGSNYFATGHRGGLLRFWDVERWQSDLEMDWGTGRVQSLAFSPDGTLGAVAGEQGEIIVWDVDV